ncbi:MAG: hypothetical protein RBR40_07615 [Tenuifilaceae bacterium]|nr:hypothetical protein [Tenuifilaceae bacterium]
MRIKLGLDMVRYNLKIVFANKFVYFLIAAIAYFLLLMGIGLFSPSASITVEDVYTSLLFPGILIIFYPVLFNIQNDKDARMLEIIFAVPNYRYKVYLLRFLISIGVLLVLLLAMSGFTVFAILRIPVFKMVYQLMVPLIFLACLGFLMSSLTRNASGAAVVMILIGLFFWIMSNAVEFSKWNIFINPFSIPQKMSLAVWSSIIRQNRLILLVGSIISLLWTLINLQKREKYV